MICQFKANSSRVLDDLAGSIKGRIKVAKVNVDEVADVAGRFGIQAIPTLLLLNDGNEIQRFVGMQTKKTLHEAMNGF